MSLLARVVATAAGIAIVTSIAACGTVRYSQGTGNIRIPVFSFRGELESVAAASPDDAWAVGFSGAPVNDPRTLMVHWDGRTWSRVTSLRMLDEVPGGLSDVTAVSGNDVWAVGATGTTTATLRPLMVHWDGTRWSQVTSLPTVTGGLSGITMSTHSGMAVGSSWVTGHARPLILRWDGAVWRQQPAPADTGDVALDKVAASLDGTAWAVGNAIEGGNLPLRSVLMRWSGSSWQTASFPLAGPKNLMLSVAIGPDGTAWTVGQHETVVSPGKLRANGPPLSVRWTGATWQAVPVPGPKGGFFGVTVAPGGAVWAVGGTGSVALAMKWTGSAWASVPVPDDVVPGASGALVGVAFSSPTDGWAVGVNFETGKGGQPEYLPLIVHWDGTAWD